MDKASSEMQKTAQGWIKDQAIAQATPKGGLHVELQNT